MFLLANPVNSIGVNNKMNIDGIMITQEQLDVIIVFSPGEITLIGANLSGANLHCANLSGANLIGADLRGSELIGADLSGANLHGAILPDGSAWNKDTDMSVFTNVK